MFLTFQGLNHEVKSLIVLESLKNLESLSIAILLFVS